MHARQDLPPRRPRGRSVVVAPLALSALLSACQEESSGPELTPVTSGTISGIPFTVTDGTIYQVGQDGPVRALDPGGRIVFDSPAGALGASDPDLLHVRTYFALSQDGSLELAAFGDAGAPFDTGVGIELARDDSLGIVYALRFAGTLVADSTLDPQPQIVSAEHWVAMELYADSVPGSPAGEAGAALWPVDDLSPAAVEDVLGCASDPSTHPTPFTGDAVGYDLRNVWLLEVEVADPIVGPCS